MMKAFPAKAACLALGILLLAACSTEPNKQKRKYLTSAEQYFKRGEYQAAVVELRNAVQIDPNYAEAHYQLARTYVALGNRDAALKEFQQTVGLEPSNFDAQ